MVLTVPVAGGLVVLGLVGLIRGVRPGLVALAGTMLAAVLLDLWQERWAAWVRETIRPEQPALPIFLVFAGMFLLVALLVGYGGGILLPRRSPKLPPPGLLERVLGGLLGALNGALIAGYLLRYAEGAWADDTITARVADSVLAATLEAWLPWFMLALVGATGIFVLVRTVLRFMRAVNAPPPVAAPPPRPPAPAPAAQATAQQLSEKMAQALQETKK